MQDYCRVDLVTFHFQSVSFHRPRGHLNIFHRMSTPQPTVLQLKTWGAAWSHWCSGFRLKKHAWTSQLDQNDRLSCFLNQWVLSGWCEDHRLLLLLWNKLCSNRSARTYFSCLWRVELIVALTGVITQNSMAVRHQVKHYNTSLQLSMCSHEWGPEHQGFVPTFYCI